MISSWLLTLLMDSKFKGIQNLMLSWPRVHIKLYIYIYVSRKGRLVIGIFKCIICSWHDRPTNDGKDRKTTAIITCWLRSRSWNRWSCLTELHGSVHPHWLTIYTGRAHGRISIISPFTKFWQLLGWYVIWLRCYSLHYSLRCLPLSMIS